MEIRSIAQEQWFLSNITIMWGFLHTSWNNVIKRHLARTRRSSHKRLSILSNIIWEITEDSWKHWNSIEHWGDETNERSKEINNEPNNAVDEIYDSAPLLRHLPVTSRQFFGKGRVWKKTKNQRQKEMDKRCKSRFKSTRGDRNDSSERA